MTEEELRAKERAARRELPVTRECFDRIRESAVNNLVRSKPNEAEKRELLYRLIHILDCVQNELETLAGRGSEDIEKYIKSLTS